MGDEHLIHSANQCRLETLPYTVNPVIKSNPCRISESGCLRNPSIRSEPPYQSNPRHISELL